MHVPGHPAGGLAVAIVDEEFANVADNFAGILSATTERVSGRLVDSHLVLRRPLLMPGTRQQARPLMAFATQAENNVTLCR